MYFCQNCGTKASPEDRDCIHCGAALDGISRCVDCGCVLSNADEGECMQCLLMRKSRSGKFWISKKKTKMTIAKHKRKIVSSIVGTLILLFCGYLFILSINHSVEEYNARQVSILQKPPAKVVIDNTSITDKGQGGERKWQRINITFRETTGSCSVHVKGTYSYIDSDGSNWNVRYQYGSYPEFEFDIPAGGSYLFSVKEYNGPISIDRQLFGYKYFESIKLYFSFTDEAGRHDQSITRTFTFD